MKPLLKDRNISKKYIKYKEPSSENFNFENFRTKKHDNKDFILFYF